MSFFRRLVGGGIVDLRSVTFGNAGKTLAELTDDELEEELLRRRRARAESRARGGPASRTGVRDDPERQQLVQYYANLELPPFAPLDEVKRAYRELVKRYHPDRHASDPERHRVATELTRSLTRAYEAIVSYLERH